jgi:hypothetical protein
MSSELLQAPVDCEDRIRRPYRSPRLTVFGDMKSLTAAGSAGLEEGGETEFSPNHQSPTPSWP